MSKCPDCPEDVSAVKLAAHRAQKHPNGLTPKKRQLSELCPVCNARFPDGTMGAHKKREHADSKGRIHGLRREVIGGPGGIPYSAHLNTDGEKEYLARQREEQLDKLMISQVRARMKRPIDLGPVKTLEP